MAQIMSCDGIGRYRTEVRDEGVGQSYVAFYLDDYGAFDWRKMKEGHTLAIMYARQHFFMDGTQGVRVQQPEYIHVGVLTSLKTFS